MKINSENAKRQRMIVRRMKSGSIFSTTRPGSAEPPPRSLEALRTSLPVRTEKELMVYEYIPRSSPGLLPDALRRGFASARWPGRFELLSRDPVFLLDGSHNPHGMSATAESLKAFFPDGGIHFLVGAMADKDVRGMTRMLWPLAASFTAVRPENARSMDAEELRGILAESGRESSAAPTVEEGVRSVLEKAKNGGAACALGSFYFSADVRAAVEKLLR